jgi:hypothetical protein
MAATVRNRLGYLSFLLAIRLCILLSPIPRAAAQTNSYPPALILESTNTIYRMGGKNSQLLIRLRQDGTVEWEEPRLDKSHKLRTASIPPEQVASISKRLAALKKDTFRAKMGPYRTYTDTSVELQIRTMTSSGSVAFLVLNPWLCQLPSCSMGNSKPMPKDVKTVICEVSELHAQLAGGSVDPMCKPQ